MMPVAVRGRREVQLGAGVAAGVAFEAGGVQAVEVVLPQLGLLGAQLVQIAPGVQAGVVAVGEGRLHRVVADRVQRRDADVALAHLQNLLALPVTAHFGRWRIHAQQFERNRERRAVVKTDVENARLVVDRQASRLRCGFVHEGWGAGCLKDYIPPQISTICIPYVSKARPDTEIWTFSTWLTCNAYTPAVKSLLYD